ncbi:MAG: hypothetical protein JXB14_03050 [Candidatus Altiarchaeota archaeon]|nr:hypothetical protein [Candidatus Altiarchaeota archaeon]
MKLTIILLALSMLSLTSAISIESENVLVVVASGCTPIGAEIPDNPVDEDCDGWLDTTLGFSIRATHPRVLLTAEKLQEVIDRMYGPNARDPYKRWFDLIKGKVDSGAAVDLANLALVYRATKDPIYKEKFISRIPSSGTPSLTELFGVDIMFDELSDDTKRKVMKRVSDVDSAWWRQTSWGYHSAIYASVPLAYSGIFAFTDVELSKDPAIYTFDAAGYIKIAQKELSPSGSFYKIENRVGGDPTYNNALPGSFGGMYDNFGYDAAEESYSVYLTHIYSTLTGEKVYENFLRDKYKARFYQNMQYPHIYTYYSTNQWCHKAGTEMHIVARIWNTRTDYITQPSHAVLLAYLYQDPKMNYYVNNGVWRELCGYAYDGMYMDLIFYDDSLQQSPPPDNPTAMYFNGPGFVSMREDWTNNAAFAVFMAGEGLSRRYEDANSFLLSRKTTIITHAGARVRFDYDNDKHHWYHIRSISKNTMKIFDPLESFDIKSGGAKTDLHSGTRLVDSDNMGGQIFETQLSSKDLVYGGTSRYSCSAYPLGVCERANIIKYEHIPGEYTYSVGDGTDSYTKKIDFFEREFLYIRPDVFITFDRVRSVDPSYKKVWTIHTIDEPVVSGTASETSHGMKAYGNARGTLILNSKDATHIDSLLPKQNKIVVRGGDTVLTSGNPLRPGIEISGSKILESDIPRWLEIFAVGSDVIGSLTLHGDAQEGSGTTETIVFDGTTQTYVTSKPTSLASTQLQDTTRNWQTDQWKGYVVRVKFSSGSPDTDVIITGNNQNILFGSFPSGNCWQYVIFRPLANSYKHWKKITRITTDDMDADDITISIPHYFDAEDATGRLHSFAPHTDGKNDGYGKRKDLGQWTFEIEATQPSNLDNFLNVISLKDPGVSKPPVKLIEGPGVSGALVGSHFAVFANEEQGLSSFSVTFPQGGSVEGLFLDLIPDTDYYYGVDGNVVSVSTSNNGGRIKRSSGMGTMKVSLNLGSQVWCTSDSDCSDSNACTLDRCEDGACSYLSIDLDGSGNIGMGDVMQITLLWTAQEGDADYDPNKDLDFSGAIGMGDVMMITPLWTQSCP